MDKNSKIVVFGASGLVGSAIVRKLLEKGYYNIIGTIHKRNPLIPYPLILIPIDLTNQQSVADFFKKYQPEYVFLAAAKVGGILANNTYKADFIHDNIVIASNIIHSAYKYGVKKLLNLGSSCIYPKFAPQPMKEEHLLTGPLEPTNEPYAIAKIAAIKLCRYFNEQYNTNFLSVMPTNLYGPNDNFDLETSHVLPALIRKIHLGKCLEENNWEEVKKDLDRRPIEGIDGKSDKEEILKILEKYGIKIGIRDKRYGIWDRGYDVRGNKEEMDRKEIYPLTHTPFIPVSVEIWGTGNPFREFLYVDDMADACVFVMENIEAKDMKKLSEDYFVNIGTGEDIRIRDLVELIKKIIGFKGKIEYNPEKPDGTPKKLLDVSKINQLGWTARTGLEEGIRKVYEWYLGNG